VSGSQFSAADAALGYLYQVRCALLYTLRRQKSEPDFLVSLETLDDVTFERAGGEPSELLQTKHHRQSAATLTNSSPDVWKTLRVWFEGHASGVIPASANLVLVTTATAKENSVAWYLRASAKRDEQAARSALDAVAQSSTNQSNAPAYKAYLARKPSDRLSVLSRVVVIDAAPSIQDLDGELRDEVHWAVGREHHVAFLQRLEGWWLRRVLRQLVTGERHRIAAVELETQMADLREQFKQAALPIDDDLLDFSLDEATAAAHAQFAFVRQIDLVKAGRARVAAAIRDYLRAFEQRSRWLRERLILEMELGRYERRLIEEWELVFAGMQDELGTEATDTVKQQAARSVLLWAERASFPIRTSVTEPFVTRGSLHMLSDECRIGWHPEFRDRLEKLLLPIPAGGTP
jgi:hypothetical protein